MGRKLRIEYYGAIYHIIQRGNNRAPIFRDEKNKIYLLELLNESKEIYDFELFAYVIMNNHYHFLLRTLNIPISKIMHNINTKYAKYYNEKISRTGPVFEDRYKGILVQDESYFLTLIRYIHNNPVAANLSKSMEEYKWSSDVFYRMNIGNIVDIDIFLEMLSLDRKKAIEKYVELMKKQDSHYEVLKDIYEKKPIIGSKEFIKSIDKSEEDKKRTLDEILKLSCPTENEFKLIKAGSRKRYLTKYKVEYIELGKKEGYTYKQIGENIGVSGPSVRKIFKK
ncbi:transposase [Schnuerera sp.]|uniref:transposase n=1 Tax=Schnuerera sp. TaxID=2794844 RepID=UPI002B8F6289|nr:transposase [Schnuerera sp.]HSH36584.1 transposase [Schnuerera sp.]